MKNRAASALIKEGFSEEAVRDVSKKLLEEIGGKVTCAFVFVTTDYEENLNEFVELVRVHGHVPDVFGCTGNGLIGTREETEQGPGFSMLFLYLPETALKVFSFNEKGIEDWKNPSIWRSKCPIKKEDVEVWVAMCNPFTVPADLWVKAWNQVYPGILCVGGLASGSLSGEKVTVFHNGEKCDGMAIALKGGIEMKGLVSQGCQPIGEPYTVTRADRNVIYSLGSQTAYDVLNDAFSELTEEERKNARGNLFAGIASSEYVEDFGRGDFLIRHIIGADPQSGAIAVEEFVRVGQTMQFQLRDHRSAHEDMEAILKGEKKRKTHPFASLLFTCTGRGKSLFGDSSHDAALLADVFGEIPNSGFFCNGEIGPVGEANFVHGYTASILLFVDSES